MLTTKADICLILEGTYPFVSGGVSSWTHHLIQSLPDYRFQLVTLLPNVDQLRYHYELPENVVGIQNVKIHRLFSGSSSIKNSDSFFRSLYLLLAGFSESPSRDLLEKLCLLLRSSQKKLGKNVLLNSLQSWDLLCHMYMESFSSESFLDYFWSWRALHQGLFSTLLCPLPQARLYHSLSTGYGGMLLSRAKVEKQAPCLLTEHGIYTNERRIEIGSADWIGLNPYREQTLSSKQETLKDFWTKTFSAYSKICYECCDQIITLFAGNQKMQREDGADEKKLNVIPNGIDADRFLKLRRRHHTRPTVAFIGRVVPIKDIKTLLLASSLLKEDIPNLRVWILGPTDEDEDYSSECMTFSHHLGLHSTVEFTGKVDISNYLPEVDVLVLSSISEAQPLVLLEAGAAGVPCVATDVGDCQDLLNGREEEDRKIGPGGFICPLADPEELKDKIYILLKDKQLADTFGQNAKLRVSKYYHKNLQVQRYRELYETYLR